MIVIYNIYINLIMNQTDPGDIIFFFEQRVLDTIFFKFNLEEEDFYVLLDKITKNESLMPQNEEEICTLFIESMNIYNSMM